MVITDTPQQKLLYIAKQLGLKSLAGMQGKPGPFMIRLNNPQPGLQR